VAAVRYVDISNACGSLMAEVERSDDLAAGTNGNAAGMAARLHGWLDGQGIF
jgi:hypothetical protein